MKESYGETIKSYRINLGLTQNEVAMDLDVTPGYISNVENGLIKVRLNRRDITIVADLF